MEKTKLKQNNKIKFVFIRVHSWFKKLISAMK